MIDLKKLSSFDREDVISFRCHYVDGYSTMIDKLYMCNKSLGNKYYELDLYLFGNGCIIDNDYYNKEILSCITIGDLLGVITRRLSVKRNDELYRSHISDIWINMFISYCFLFVVLLILSCFYFKYF